MNKWNSQQPEPGTDMPIALLADGRMMDLSGRACNLVVQFVYPDAIGCSTIAVMHLRPDDQLADVCLNSDVGEVSRIKFARLLESMARSLRHYKPGQVGIDDIPKEETE
ncbi:hypothetical protein BW12_06935 [Bifidobacterium sp. UTCIF-3]|uniref:hypothetical protein n=1 Tax=unclassified Bifidobacterium TaxID=2608897 RepID=UPI001129CE66|nr:MULTISPECIES: hypothetical protein [unclassified Bifidobacterium]TPF78377.1 hypothetical protein BW09_04810 [Bifidobacterium sp. UTCIF-1]TPF81203.1 hypothetical protein BW08_00770 [Bifidobacterium sp. UTCIF-24]TPF81983.1 hypothetical protein BW12_06935 [Bifidobacterium sp. UTCIF-3]TPF85169.1 hypothetical protein BW07_00415 [Bifidobacterium sp. UTCIF-36]